MFKGSHSNTLSCLHNTSGGIRHLSMGWGIREKPTPPYYNTQKNYKNNPPEAPNLPYKHDIHGNWCTEYKTVIHPRDLKVRPQASGVDYSTRTYTHNKTKYYQIYQSEEMF